jgi:hypothetical protein
MTCVCMCACVVRVCVCGHVCLHVSAEMQAAMTAAASAPKEGTQVLRIQKLVYLASSYYCISSVCSAPRMKKKFNKKKLFIIQLKEMLKQRSSHNTLAHVLTHLWHTERLWRHALQQGLQLFQETHQVPYMIYSRYIVVCCMYISIVLHLCT